MEKRKFKLNILDFVIFVVILCSVAVLVFRDTVNEFFTEPEMTTLQITFFVDGEDNMELIGSSLGADAMLVHDTENEIQIAATVKSLKVAPGSLTVPQKGDVTVCITGYKRLGRFYTEGGERLYADEECILIIGETSIEGKVLSVGLNG